MNAGHVVLAKNDSEKQSGMWAGARQFELHIHILSKVNSFLGHVFFKLLVVPSWQRELPLLCAECEPEKRLSQKVGGAL